MKYLKIVFLFFIVLLFYTCKINYSFTGADISPDVKTVQIDFFNNKASLVQPSLSSTLTETIRDKFTTQTNLGQTASNGDLVFEGDITDYNVSAQAYQGDETSALTRLTISIHMKFTNNKDPKKSCESSFSRYADFDSSQSLMAVENELIQQICEELAIDIFNKTIANW